MKALRITCPHPDKEKRQNPEAGKNYWKEVGTLLVPDWVHDGMKEKNDKLTYIPNDNPDVSFVVWPPKDWDNENSRGGGKPNW